MAHSLSQKRPYGLIIGSALFLLLLLVVFSGCNTGMQEPTDLTAEAKRATELLPATSSYVMMMDVRHVRDNSPEGEQMFSKMMDQAGERRARFRDFVEATGFDPKTDLNRVYLASGPDADAEATTVLLYGAFDTDKIRSYVASNAKGDVRISTDGDATLFTLAPNAMSGADLPDDGPTLAIASDELAILSGTRATVTETLGRLRNGGQALSSNDTMMPLVRRAANGQSMWFVTANLPRTDIDEVDTQSLQGEQRKMARVAKAVKDVAASFSFTDGGELDAVFHMNTQQDAAASDVADIIRGLAAAARQSKSSFNDFESALDNLDVREYDESVQVSTRVSRNSIETMMKKG